MAEQLPVLQDISTGSTGPVLVPGTPRVSRLRAILVIGDLLAVTIGWSVAALALREEVFSAPVLVAMVLGTVALTMGVLVSQRLYRSRVCTIQSIEIQRLGRTVAISLGLLAVVAVAAGSDVSVGPLLVGTAVVFVLLTTHRMGYRTWLDAQRRTGRFHRPVILVGAGPEADGIEQLLAEQPETGFELRGVVCPASQRGRTSARWLGEGTAAVAAARRVGATGAIVDANAWPPDQLNRIIRDLLGQDLHVHVSSGLQGISARRMSVVPIAHEPILYIEALQFSPWQARTKRVLDVLITSVLGVLALPIIAVAAIAIKLDNPGPVFFRQERVGQGSKTFEMVKLRTMVVGAADRLHEVEADNGRSGPLFKAAADPRVTRVGRFLRASSIDELPQLWNVLQGAMSLVGPRPALASEIAEFDDDLTRMRLDVPPGITGLWQVEARDNPAFGAYRRLDLFYVENWSVGLDLGILIATVGAVLARTVRAVRPTRRRDDLVKSVDSPALLD